MTQWQWLTTPQTPYTRGFVIRVLVKAILLFIAVNLLWVIFEPMRALGNVSVYNTGLVAGRPRLPYGENPAQSYNLSLYNLDSMFKSHVVSRRKLPNEYRVLLIGDSSTWGILLKPEETLAGILNDMNTFAPDGRRIRFYNIGHPVMSLSKDLLLLDYAMRYEPDAIVWLFTAQSFPQEQQLSVPLVQNNAEAMRRLINDYDLSLDPQDERFVDATFLAKTLVGQRREIADWMRFQLYGFAWNATGIDQYYPETYAPRSEDFDEDVTWQGFSPDAMFSQFDMVFDVLEVGLIIAGDVPVLLVNEPMFISTGENSDLRYNSFYPRWAYDRYRDMLGAMADEHLLQLLDLWDAIEPSEFTDTPVHLTPEGSRQLAEHISTALRNTRFFDAQR